MCSNPQHPKSSIQDIGFTGFSQSFLADQFLWMCIPVFLMSILVSSCSNDTDDADTPQIISLNTSEPTLTPGESVVVSAIVLPGATESAITSGIILNAQTQVASFSQVAPNTFETTVPWDNWVDESTAGTAGATIGVIFTAQFFDEEGRTVTAEAQLDLACESIEEAICQSSCLPTDTSDHCGGCNHTCGEDVEGTTTFTLCNGSECGTAYVESEDRRSCADICSDARYLGVAMRCEPSCVHSESPVNVWTFGEGNAAGLIAYGETFRVTSVKSIACAATPPATIDWAAEALPYFSQQCCCAANF